MSQPRCRKTPAMWRPSPSRKGICAALVLVSMAHLGTTASVCAAIARGRGRLHGVFHVSVLSYVANGGLMFEAGFGYILVCAACKYTVNGSLLRAAVRQPAPDSYTNNARLMHS